jgi:hypothetical protein
MKAKEKRKARAYKISDKDYKKAMRRAKKEKTPLASMIEEVLIGYGEGAYSITFKQKS